MISARVLRRHQLPLLLATAGIFFLVLFNTRENASFSDSNPSIFLTNEKLKVVVVGKDNMQGVKRRKQSLEAQACTLPKLEQNGAEMMQFIAKAKPLPCDKKEKNWVFIDKEGRMRKIEERKEAKCTIQYFERKTDFENTVHPEEPFEEGTKMKKDFAEVQCTWNAMKWKGLLISIARNEKLVETAKAKSGDFKSGKDRLDMVMFGFDSMSQQHFRRKMAATMKQLEKMGSVTLNGYNIVGDGTPQAFIPILTGKTELEMPNTRKRYKDARFVDDAYPFIWKNFSDAGYVTVYGEDAYYVGVYTYRLKGFRKQPTDHYMRPFYGELENGKKWGNSLCMGSEPTHKSWFRYGYEFMKEYKDVGKFLLLHEGALSHDDINLIEAEDEDYANILKDMEEEGLLDNAVLITMADHGHRFMKIRDTHQGQLEERLPMFSVRLPPKFVKTELGAKMLKNLETNKDRLTTPFDVHATLLDILKLPEDVVTMQDKTKRSLSMFRPIPQDRSCEQAGVEPHWCTCLNWQNATATRADRAQTQILAEGLVAAIDSQIENFRNLCANVTLKRIISANKLTPNDGLLKYNNVKDKDGFVPGFGGKAKVSFAHYQLKVETTPNNAVYEATVFFDARRNELEVDLTSLSHVNRYGDDPHCIIDDHFALAHFCVCHDKVRNT